MDRVQAAFRVGLNDQTGHLVGPFAGNGHVFALGVREDQQVRPRPPHVPGQQDHNAVAGRGGPARCRLDFRVPGGRLDGQ